MAGAAEEEAAATDGPFPLQLLMPDGVIARMVVHPLEMVSCIKQRVEQRWGFTNISLTTLSGINDINGNAVEKALSDGKSVLGSGLHKDTIVRVQPGSDQG